VTVTVRLTPAVAVDGAEITSRLAMPGVMLKVVLVAPRRPVELAASV